MNRTKRCAGVLAALTVLALLSGGAGPARADVLLPAVSGAVEDANNDGTGDFVATDSSFPIIRRLSPPQFPLSNLADVALLEYDMAAFRGLALTEATLTGLVSVNNALPTGPRIVEVLLYGGNGVLEPGDFEAPGLSLGTVTYQPEAGVFSAPFDFNVLSQVQGLLDSGATHVGVRFSPVNVQAPGVVTNAGAPFQPTLTLTATPVPEPGALALAGLGGLGLLGYGRRQQGERRRARPR